MSRMSLTFGAIGGVDGNLARGDVEARDGAAEELERGDGLVVGDFVAGLVDARKGEIAVFARLAVLDAVDGEWHIARGVEFVTVRPLRAEGDGFAAEPVADVVGVAVDEGDSHRGRVEELLEIFNEVHVDKVAGLLECVVDVVVGQGVIGVDAEGISRGVQIEIIGKV